MLLSCFSFCLFETEKENTMILIFYFLLASELRGQVSYRDNSCSLFTCAHDLQVELLEE